MTDVNVSPKPAFRQSRWLFPAFVVSLALNLLLVGGLGAAAWHRRHGPHHGRGGEFGLMGFVRELPSDRQAIVKGQLSASRKALKPMRRAVRDAMTEANAVLAVEPFDKEKFKVALAKVAEAEAQLKAAISGALADTAETLSPEERKHLQEWREKRRPGWFRHSRRDDDEDVKGDDGAARPAE